MSLNISARLSFVINSAKIRFRLGAGRNKALALIVFAAMICQCPMSMAFTVVLDAGHGGKDPGALGTYSKEKNINLNVVLKLGKLIEQNCKGVKVRYTRTTDKFVELKERANIANNAKADLFISVHTNSTAVGNTAVGSETYSLSLERANANLEVVKRENSVIQYEANRLKYSSTSVENSIMNEIIQSQNMRISALFAKSIQDEYVAAGRPNKGVHQAGFFVLKMTAMPSVLTELGFISTPSEEAYLNSEKGINELANSIFRAFQKYISPILRSEEENEESLPNQTAKKEVYDPQSQTTAHQKDVQTNTHSGEHPSAAETTHREERKTATTSGERQMGAPRQGEALKRSITNQPRQANKTKTEAWDGKYVFKVQICTSNRNLRPDSEQFKGLTGVESFPITINGKQQFVHTYGSSTSYSEIAAIKNKVKEKFADCFIVVFKNGERISGSEASAAFKKQP